MGPAKDEQCLFSALNELQIALKSASNNKWDIVMEISAKPKNIYMGEIFNILNIEKCLTNTKN